jgi:mycoredoxin
MQKFISHSLQFLVLAGLLIAGMTLGAPAHDLYARWFPPQAFTQGDFRSLRADPSIVVMVFGTSTCPYCKAARTFFAEQNIAFTDFVIDQSTDARRRFATLHSEAVPVVIVGERKIIGWQPQAVQDALLEVGTNSQRASRIDSAGFD